MKKYIILLLPIIFLSACIPDPVEIEIPQAETRLVLASQLLFNQGVLVQVSKSFNALTETPTNGDTVEQDFLDLLLVDSARVVLEGPNIQDTLLNLEQGFYLNLGTELLENEIYRLSVFDSATGLSVFAQTEVLERAEFNSVAYRFREQSIDFQDTVFKDTSFDLFISFDDLEGDNYYMLNLYRISQDGSPQPAENLFTLNQGQPTFTFTDALLSGETFFDTLSYSGIGFGDTVGVALSHISKEYYEFLNARQRSGSSIFAALLGEPVNYPSNVEGGYGFFNLYFPSTEVIVAE
ncbi:MAG: DUF4249 domain-containing protein [Bacteroidia bacterium]|nr:DUF4249 domain-containing protein [Bacteroidia bacterium]